MTAYNLSARVNGDHVDGLEDGIGLWCHRLIGNSLRCQAISQNSVLGTFFFGIRDIVLDIGKNEFLVLGTLSLLLLGTLSLLLLGTMSFS